MDDFADERLLALAALGEQLAYQELDYRYRPRLTAFARRRGADLHEADEIAQQTLVQAFLKLSTLRNPNRFSSWLYTIAGHLLSDAGRRRGMPQSLDVDGEPDGTPDPAEVVASRDQEECLFRLASRVLNEDQYRVIWLRYVDGLSPGEIARQVRRSRVWVRVTLSRARKRLSHVLLEGERS